MKELVCKKRVLLVANYAEGVGGISGQVELIHKHLKEEGIKSDIFSLGGGVFRRLWAYTRLLLKISRYDIVNIHACSHRGFLPAIAGVRAGRLLDKKIILTYHGGEADTFFSKHTKLCRRIFCNTDVNIVLSGYLASVFEKYGFPYTVIPNIIDIPDGVFRARSLISPRFISIRSLEPVYNIQCILKAFAIVKKQLPEATLDILGSGSMRNQLEQFVMSENIEGVKFRGRIPNGQIIQWLDKADVMVSAPLADNQPMSLLEAFSCGLLVISSNVGGVPYMISDGVNGLLFPSGDYEMLAGKMLEAVNGGSSSVNMTLAAYRGLDKHRWESVKPLLLEAYGIDYV